MTPEEAAAADAEHRRVLAIFVGLLLAQFIAMMSNTIVGNAMPVIVAEIGGTQQQYTWVLTSGILANTVTTPLAGKFADLYDKKKLFLLFISIFIAGSVLSGAAPTAEFLIAARVLQGIGMGGQIMLSQIIFATIVPPRQRGRYNGYMGAVMAVATVSGPVIGGFIVDIPWLGWRWCFWIAVPLMLLTMIVINRRLTLDVMKREHTHVDIAGAFLVAVAASALLILVSLGGKQFPWISMPALVLVAIVLIGVLILGFVESHSREPLLPGKILFHRTTVLAIIASIATGAAMFGTNVFLGQYFQFGRGFTPTIAGLLGLPMVFGILAASTYSGRLVTLWGRWKGVVVVGMILMTAGSAAAITIGQHTNLWLVGLWLLLIGVGLGASNMNLVLAVQNTVALQDMGVATSTVTFFRTLAGALCIQLFGVFYGIRVEEDVAARLGEVPAEASATSGTLDLDSLPAPIEAAMRGAYGDSVSVIFFSITLLSVVGLIATLFMRGTSLRSTVDVQEILDADDDRRRPTD